jgi:putative ABC transport system substrate-binding protein
MIGRRQFITLLGGAAATWPLAARAQHAGQTPRVGYIRAGTPNNDPFREEFVRGMRDLGYVEGRNITYEFRHYGDDVESIPSLIGDLLRVKVDIIVTGGTVAGRSRTLLSPCERSGQGRLFRKSGSRPSSGSPWCFAVHSLMRPGEGAAGCMGAHQDLAAPRGPTQRQLQAWPVHRRGDRLSQVAQAVTTRRESADQATASALKINSMT